MPSPEYVSTLSWQSTHHWVFSNNVLQEGETEPPALILATLFKLGQSIQYLLISRRYRMSSVVMLKTDLPGLEIGTVPGLLALVESELNPSVVISEDLGSLLFANLGGFLFVCLIGCFGIQDLNIISFSAPAV